MGTYKPDPRKVKCNACEGNGTYPIHDAHGDILMDIECPICFGAGTVLPDNAVERRAAESIS